MAEGVNIIDTSGVDTANVDNSELVYKCVDDISSSGKTICEMLLQSLDEQQQIWTLADPLIISVSLIEKRRQIVVLQSFA